MDLIHSEGYGEALSGGEREHALTVILCRMLLKGRSPEAFPWYLAAAEHGLSPSAGFGIGVVRLIRWVCGLPDAALTSLFPKRIGDWSL